MVALRDKNKIKSCVKQNSPDSKYGNIIDKDAVLPAQAFEKLNREERLKMAMTAMNDGAGMVYTEAVKLFNVKRSTLHDHMSSKCLKFTKGRYPLLTAVEERALLEMLRSLHYKGYTITSHICRRAAFMYAQRCNYSLAGVGEQQMAGRKWFSAFVKRNNVTINNSKNFVTTKSECKSRRHQLNLKSTKF